MERFERGSPGSAGAAGDPYNVYLGNWTIESLDNTGSQVRLRASEGDIGLDLRLTAKKPIVAHGESGYSPKGEEPGNATFYLSFTDMQTEGTLKVLESVWSMWVALAGLTTSGVQAPWVRKRLGGIGLVCSLRMAGS